MKSTLRTRLLAVANEIESWCQVRERQAVNHPNMAETCHKANERDRREAQQIRGLASDTRDLALVQFEAWLRQAVPEKASTIDGSMLRAMATLFLRGESVAVGESYYRDEFVTAYADAFTPDPEPLDVEG